MVAKQQWSPNTNGRQTQMAAKQKWPPNKNGRQTKMVAEHKWSPNKNGRQTKIKIKINKNGRGRIRNLFKYPAYLKDFLENF